MTVSIIISGPPAVGKTTLAKRLAHDLGLEHLSGGDILKEMAQKQGFDIGGNDWWDTTTGMNFLGKRDQNSNFDIEVDTKLAEFCGRGNVVITSYTLPWLLAKNPSAKIAAVMNRNNDGNNNNDNNNNNNNNNDNNNNNNNDNNSSSNNNLTTTPPNIIKIWLDGSHQNSADRMQSRDNMTNQQALEITKNRYDKNKNLYKKLYDFEFKKDDSVFDVIINTDDLNADQVVQIAKSTIQKLSDINPNNKNNTNSSSSSSLTTTHTPTSSPTSST